VNGVDPNLISTSQHRFVNGNDYESDVVVKDDQKVALFRIQGTSKRVSGEKSSRRPIHIGWGNF